MILEELEKPDSIAFHHVFNLEHEFGKFSNAAKVSCYTFVGALCASGGPVDDVFENVGVSEELCIANLEVFFAVDQGNLSNLLLTEGEPESVHDLAEDGWTDFEVAVLVAVLEETLRVKTVFADQVGKLFHQLLHSLSLLPVSLLLRVDGGGAGHVYLPV